MDNVIQLDRVHFDLDTWNRICVAFDIPVHSVKIIITVNSIDFS
jgi:hypothetical protein